MDINKRLYKNNFTHAYIKHKMCNRETIGKIH